MKSFCVKLKTAPLL